MSFSWPVVFIRTVKEILFSFPVILGLPRLKFLMENENTRQGEKEDSQWVKEAESVDDTPWTEGGGFVARILWRQIGKVSSPFTEHLFQIK